MSNKENLNIDKQKKKLTLIDILLKKYKNIKKTLTLYSWEKEGKIV
jgi:hypothetical protein